MAAATRQRTATPLVLLTLNSQALPAAPPVGQRRLSAANGSPPERRPGGPHPEAAPGVGRDPEAGPGPVACILPITGSSLQQLIHSGITCTINIRILINTFI